MPQFTGRRQRDVSHLSGRGIVPSLDCASMQPAWRRGHCANGRAPLDRGQIRERYTGELNHNRSFCLLANTITFVFSTSTVNNC